MGLLDLHSTWYRVSWRVPRAQTLIKTYFVVQCGRERDELFFCSSASVCHGLLFWVVELRKLWNNMFLYSLPCQHSVLYAHYGSVISRRTIWKTTLLCSCCVWGSQSRWGIRLLWMSGLIGVGTFGDPLTHCEWLPSRYSEHDDVKKLLVAGAYLLDIKLLLVRRCNTESCYWNVTEVNSNAMIVCACFAVSQHSSSVRVNRLLSSFVDGEFCVWDFKIRKRIRTERCGVFTLKWADVLLKHLQRLNMFFF